MPYITIPKEVRLKEIINNDHSLSPKDFRRVKLKNQNVLSIGKICSVQQGTFIDKSDRTLVNTGIKYITIRNIKGVIPDLQNIEYVLPKPIYRNLSIQSDTIFFSDAGTLGKNCFLDEEVKGINADGITTLRSLNEDEYPIRYVFACVMHPYFGELIRILAPSGSTQQNTEIKHFKLAYIPFPNQINKEEIIKYVDVLVGAITNKEKEIKKKRLLISDLIEKELFENQKKKRFNYENPSSREIQNKLRLDTGVYTKQFKQIDFLIKNYERGVFHIEKGKIKSGSTPIKRFISEKRSCKYRWIIPTRFSDYGTLSNDESINCKTNNLSENAMLLVNRTSKGGRGEYVGMAVYYDFEKYGKGQHNQGVYRVIGYPVKQLQFMTCFMNFGLIRKYCAGLSVGSKMKEIKSKQFLKIPFPNFSKNKQEVIAKLYHNQKLSASYQKCNIKAFLENDENWNEQAGIIQLDMAKNKIRKQIERLVYELIMDKRINIDFSFLNKC